MVSPPSTAFNPSPSPRTSQKCITGSSSDTRRGPRAPAERRAHAARPVLEDWDLNLLGSRQSEIYGRETLADVENECRRAGAELGLEIEFRQTNAEFQLIDWIHEAAGRAAGIVMNPAAFSHTSVAVLDALNTCGFPILEVHISNIHQREEFRRHSFVSGVAAGVICGCGTHGYVLAIQHLARLI